VVVPEVRVELGERVEGEMRELAGRLELGELGEPLSDQVKIAGVAGALDELREDGLELDREREALTRWQRTIERHADVGAVVRIAGRVGLGVSPQIDAGVVRADEGDDADRSRPAQPLAAAPALAAQVER